VAKGSPNGGDSEPLTARIGGIISAETRDAQGEELSQSGIDWSYFKSHGWFNHEHGRGPENVLGHPESVISTTHKGVPATRVEGVLYLGKAKAREVYETALAMSKARSTRALGFSVEGQVLAREKGKILKSKVLNVAITAHPVHPDARLEILAKSASIGYQTSAGVGTGSMSALVPQSLEYMPSIATFGTQALKRKKMSVEELARILAVSFPVLSYGQAFNVASEITRTLQ